MSLRIEIRDPRIKRLSVMAGTANPKERERRRASLLHLVETERGRAIIDRIRARKVTVEEVHRAVQSFDLASVEGEPGEDPSGVWLAATADGWLRYLEGAHRAARTLESYRIFAASLEKSMGVTRTKRGRIVRDRDMTTITRAEGERWLTAAQPKTGRPWAPKTQQIAHSVAAQLWDRAITEDADRAMRDGKEPRLTANFWRREGARKGVRGARVRKTRVEFFRRPEAGRLLWANRRTPLAAWVAVGLYAGLRSGEAANLRRGIDVDLDDGTITVQERGGEHKWRPKTDNSQRVIPLHPRLARWIRDHERRGWSGNLYLFREAGRDRPIPRWTVRDWTRDAFTAAGIRYGQKKDAMTYHSLRHTTASWMTIADVHPLKIAKILGDSVEMVLSTYSHLVDESLGEAIRKL